MRDCNTYRVHFEPGSSIEELRTSFADLLLCLYATGAWPSTIFRTADSKKRAMQNPILLQDRGKVLDEMTKSIAYDPWGELRWKGYWSPGAAESDRFVVSVGSNFISFVWGVIVVIELPLDRAEQLSAAIDCFSKACGTNFVVLKLSRENPGEVVAIKPKGGDWAENDPTPDNMKSQIDFLDQ